MTQKKRSVTTHTRADGQQQSVNRLGGSFDAKTEPGSPAPGAGFLDASEEGARFLERIAANAPDALLHVSADVELWQQEFPSKPVELDAGSTDYLTAEVEDFGTTYPELLRETRDSGYGANHPGGFEAAFAEDLMRARMSHRPAFAAHPELEDGGRGALGSRLDALAGRRRYLDEVFIEDDGTVSIDNRDHIIDEREDAHDQLQTVIDKHREADADDMQSAVLQELRDLDDLRYLSYADRARIDGLPDGGRKPGQWGHPNLANLDGLIDNINFSEEEEPGIVRVGNADGDGGTLLSEERNALIPDAFRNENGWYENGKDAPIVSLTFDRPDESRQGREANGVLERYLKNTYPTKWEQMTGTTLDPSESAAKRRFREAPGASRTPDPRVPGNTIIRAINPNTGDARVFSVSQHQLDSGEFELGRVHEIEDQS